jgi:hypothetical protein
MEGGGCFARFIIGLPSVPSFASISIADASPRAIERRVEKLTLPASAVQFDSATPQNPTFAVDKIGGLVPNDDLIGSISARQMVRFTLSALVVARMVPPGFTQLIC